MVILTNSLASNNHIPVHSAYARYRKDAIKAGADLYEIRANAARDLESREGGPGALTLHTKVILIDRRYLFVGSMNYDPRSIEINAEMGLLIDSEPMVRSYLEGADERLAVFAYRVLVNDKGQLEWHGKTNGKEVVETTEPLTSGWLRFKAWIMKIVPENQL
jgi:putative cardiolipin synthase